MAPHRCVLPAAPALLLLALPLLLPHPASPAPSGGCALAASDGTVWLLGLEDGGAEIAEVSIGGVFFERRPTPGSDALVLAYPSSVAVRLRIESAERDDESEPPLWQIHLSDGRKTALAGIEAPAGRRREAPSNAVVLWPPPEGAVLLAPSTETQLPPGVALATVKAAVDLDDDGRPELLLIEHCCSDRRRALGCEYHCSEIWQRTGDEWTLCSRRQPA